MAAHKNLGTCSYPKGLNVGLNEKDYEDCSDKMNACPKTATLEDKSCVSEVVKKEKSCKQLVKIAQLINVDPNMISIKQKSHFSMINVSFAADGGHTYYILSPRGCLINTMVDPRDINSGIKKRYSKMDLYIDNNGEPSYTNKRGIQRFSAAIQAKKQCRACDVIANAQINFDFNKDGKWLRTTLNQFKTS